MDRSTRAVLRYMVNSNPGKDGFCLFADFYDSCVAATGIPEHRVMAAVRQLHSDGFILYSPNQFGRNVGFELEIKAYHRKRYSWENVKRFLLNSVIVPIAVSLLTSLAASWLSRLSVH